MRLLLGLAAAAPYLAPFPPDVVCPARAPPRAAEPTRPYFLTIDDTTLITNALHYYKKVEKQGRFQQYTPERINDLRDRIVHQQVEGSGQFIFPVDECSK